MLHHALEGLAMMDPSQLGCVVEDRLECKTELDIVHVSTAPQDFKTIENGQHLLALAGAIDCGDRTRAHVTLTARRAVRRDPGFLEGSNARELMFATTVAWSLLLPRLNLQENHSMTRTNQTNDANLRQSSQHSSCFSC